jgi:uncharacterized protein (TIGR02246 family)
MAEDERRIRELIDQWHRASADGNVEAVLPLMSEDAVFYGPGRPPMAGRDVFERNLRELLKEWRLESTGDVIEVGVSNDLAYACVQLTVTTIHRTEPGKRVRRAGFSLCVLKRSADGTWRLVRDANMLSEVDARA